MATHGETAMTTRSNEHESSSGDLAIRKLTRRAAGVGTWVRGRLWGHRFEALVFPQHADCPDWELADSRISKLWVQRLDDRMTVFNWDRGPDQPAADAVVQAVVDLLTARLAALVYGAEGTPGTAAHPG